MDTNCQMTTQSGGSEGQNLGAINYFEDKKGGAVNFELRTYNKGSNL